MKKVIIASFFGTFLLAGTLFAQDIPQSSVPSVVLNKFQQTFPKATDVEWEMSAGKYKVDFETGAGTDHEAYYDKTGKLTRHKEDISKGSLPAKVLEKLKSAYGSYRVEDVDKITEGTKVTYSMELKSSTEEWKITFDKLGNVLSKIAD